MHTLKWMNRMACKLYLKAVFKKEQGRRQLKINKYIGESTNLNQGRTETLTLGQSEMRFASSSPNQCLWHKNLVFSRLATKRLLFL